MLDKWGPILPTTGSEHGMMPRERSAVSRRTCVEHGRSIAVRHKLEADRPFHRADLMDIKEK